MAESPVPPFRGEWYGKAGCKKCVVEFIAVTEASKELLWLKRLTSEFGFKQDNYVLFCNNQSVIHLSMNASFHSR
jgi:phage anti-repressor protein